MNKQNQIKQIAEQLIGQGNQDIIDMAFTPGYQAHVGDKTYSVYQFIRLYTKQLRKSISDIKVLKI